MATPEMTDEQWQAQNDARTLATANQIINNDSRLKAAQNAAVEMAKETADELEGLLKVAGKLGEVEGMKIIGKSD